MFRCDSNLHLKHFIIIFKKQITLKIYNYISICLFQEFYFNKINFINKITKIISYFIFLLKIFQLKSTNFFYKLKTLRLVNNKFHTFAFIRFIILSFYSKMINVLSYTNLKSFLLLWIFFIKQAYL
ncbi:hypothetical protein M951_chr351 (nucleomorph) [Lotharella oceanica]|uniref:Transmembrane protein n=1 Tax=Lotharella oceanica TaxID=641309 RepID=A0A060DB61_9EUKA|nr:hypothetical protein M951_chr351 [Lotharella oceanica]|mmetsp:Transcript_4866/g.9680  ORF Transcript_4866/g.9680 Transcript_4866/m.9680 type:complete len:126 (-) Transcript_4866:39-416(-)